MLDRARDLARTGSREAARNLLSQLQQMLENLRMAQPGQMQGGQNQAMRQMQEMMQRQQQLLDRSFRHSQQQQQGGRQQRGGDENQGDANEQEMLRQMLGEMMQQLGDQGGDMPPPLAPRRPRHARRRPGAPPEPARPGDRAADRGARRAAAGGARDGAADDGPQRQRPGGTDQGDNEGLDQAKRDPFGRLTDENGNGGIDDGGLMRTGKSPNDYALEKAKRILEELRRRAGERDRPRARARLYRPAAEAVLTAQSPSPHRGEGGTHCAAMGG